MSDHRHAPARLMGLASMPGLEWDGRFPRRRNYLIPCLVRARAKGRERCSRGQCRQRAVSGPAPGMAAGPAPQRKPAGRADAPCCARFSVKLRRPSPYSRSALVVTPGLGPDPPEHAGVSMDPGGVVFRPSCRSRPDIAVVAICCVIWPGRCCGAG